MDILLIAEDLWILLLSPFLMLLLGIVVILVAYSGKRGSRGPATGTPFLVILLIGMLIVAMGLLGLLR